VQAKRNCVRECERKSDESAVIIFGDLLSAIECFSAAESMMLLLLFLFLLLFCRDVAVVVAVVVVVVVSMLLLLLPRGCLCYCCRVIVVYVRLLREVSTASECRSGIYVSMALMS
jgi:hypothetical protein